jgi:hypothetical protein
MLRARRLRSLLTLALFVAAAAFASAKPRVLILGDSHARPIAAQITKTLQDQAEVVFATAPPEEVYDTTTALTKIDEWLGEKPWDLIYFNIGLYDLTYRAPGMQSFRVMSRTSGGIRNTSPADYEANLRQLVALLKSKNAKLVWASTLPITRSGLDILEPGSEIESNRTAARIMTEAGIPIDDLHAHALTLLTPKELESGIQPGDFNRKPIYSPTITTICRELNLKRPEDPPPFQRRR